MNETSCDNADKAAIGWISTLRYNEFFIYTNPFSVLVLIFQSFCTCIFMNVRQSNIKQVVSGEDRHETRPGAL